MKIDAYIDGFLKTQFRYNRDALKTAKTLLSSSKDYALNQMPDFEEPDYLNDNMRMSVQKIPRGKDSAISVYRKFAEYLSDQGVSVKVHFPPIPIDSSFERQMFIAKYLQSPDARIDDLPDLLWGRKQHPGLERNHPKIAG